MSALDQFPKAKVKRRRRYDVELDSWTKSKSWQVEDAVLEEVIQLDDRETTSRFLYYRLLSEQIITKSPSDAKLVSQVITQLRDQADIPMWQIVDGTRGVEDWDYWPSVEEAVTAAAKNARLDPWIGHSRPQLWVESRSLAGVLRQVAFDYRVPLVPLGGQASRGLAWEVAHGVVEETPIFYLGDWDKAGHDIEAAFATSVAALVNATGLRLTLEYLQRLREEGRVRVPAELNITRLAVTGQQVDEFDLPVVRKVDKRDGKTYEAVEAEALPQAYIEGLVEESVADLCPVDLDALEKAAREEADTVMSQLGY